MNKSIIYKAKEDKDIQEDLRKLEALQQEPCEDCISRQAVIELCEGWWLGHTKEDDFATEIRALPSVNPQKPKIGHWIYDRTRDWDGECKYECSECGMGSDVDYAYCMRCGAKMIEPQESEE